MPNGDSKPILPFVIRQTAAIQRSQEIFQDVRLLFPLPEGEGQGEGKQCLEVTMPSASTRTLTVIARNLRKRDTWAEKLLWSWLRDRRFSAYKFRRQHAFGPHILDFFCVEAFLDIELDGAQHGFPAQKKTDEARDAWLTRAGIKVLRFWNARLRRDKEIVRKTIWRELHERAAHPLPDYCRSVAVASENKQGGGDK